MDFIVIIWDLIKKIFFNQGERVKVIITNIVKLEKNPVEQEINIFKEMREEQHSPNTPKTVLNSKKEEEEISELIAKFNYFKEEGDEITIEYDGEKLK